MRLILSVILLAPLFPAGASPLYVRAGFGFEDRATTRVRDLDCASVTPPALFGCVAGSDGRLLGGYGDFGGAAVHEIAVGVTTATRLRIEAAFAERDLDLRADANFIGVEGQQPVRANGRSRAAFLISAVDLGTPEMRLRPFFAAGAGAARNETGAVTYRFPAIATDATTVVRGGRHTNVAWMVAAGATFRLTSKTELELALRMADLGEIRTESGEAMIVRPRGTFVFDIAGTRAPVQSIGAMLSLRWHPQRGR